MLICNQVNYLLCDPACPHIGPHEAVKEFEIMEIHCDEPAKCVYRDDKPMVQCVEAPCPATA